MCGTFNNMVMNLSTSISGVLTPRVTGMVVKDASKDELTNLFIRVGRLQFIVIALIVSSLLLFEPKLLLHYGLEKDYHDAYWVCYFDNVSSVRSVDSKHWFVTLLLLRISISLNPSYA